MYSVCPKSNVSDLIIKLLYVVERPVQLRSKSERRIDNNVSFQRFKYHHFHFIEVKICHQVYNFVIARLRTAGENNILYC